MKRCPKCNSSFDDKCLFCIKCGNELVNIEELKNDSIVTNNNVNNNKLINLAYIFFSISFALMFMKQGLCNLYSDVEILLFVGCFGLSIISFILGVVSKNKLALYITLFNFVLYCMNLFVNISYL